MTEESIGILIAWSLGEEHGAACGQQASTEEGLDGGHRERERRPSSWPQRTFAYPFANLAYLYLTHELPCVDGSAGELDSLVLWHPLQGQS